MHGPELRSLRTSSPFLGEPVARKDKAMMFMVIASHELKLVT